MSEAEMAAYARVGQSYDSAISMYKFAWTSYAARNAGFLVAAGFVLAQFDESPGLRFAAVVILFLGGLVSLTVARFLAYLQRIIKRALASGVLWEWKHEELGSLYRGAIPMQHRDHWEQLRKQFADTPSASHLRGDDLDKIGSGLKPSRLCYLYACFYFVGSLVLLIWLLRELP